MSTSTTVSDAAPILIAGAGPVGLTLGIELLRRGVPCRVVEKNHEPVRTSRAFTLHARTLEVFDHQGLAERFLALGIKSRGLDFRFVSEHETAHLDFTRLDSSYPFILIINQNIVENVLRERFQELGGVIEWDTELSALSTQAAGQADGQADGAITAALRRHGETEEVHPPFLVGCDGIHSFVRKNLGLAFEGDEYSGQEMRMMDVPLSGWPLGDDAIHYLIAEDRMLLVTRLPGANYRLLISDRGDSHRSETAQSDFQLLMDAYYPDVRVGVPEWATIFTLWRRVSANYRAGNTFVLGDAAHIHSPAGGQGMNACLHDAFNLGWKLALVARGEADPALLDSYEAERRPIAKQVIEGSHLMHKVMMAHGTSLAERIAITREAGYNLRAVRQVSGVAYSYRDSTPGAVAATLPGIVDGDRAPDVELGAGLRLSGLLRHPWLTLLVLQREASSSAALAALAADVAVRFGERVRVHALAAPGLDGAAVPGAIATDGPAAHDLYGAPEGDALCVVRPDGYVLVRRPAARSAEVLAALSSILGTGGATGRAAAARAREVPAAVHPQT